MVVGCLEVTLAIDAAESLKDKRSVVRRLVERTKNRFNVSVSEVGANDDHHRAVLGVATVANDGPFVNSVLDKVLDFLEDEAIGRAEIVGTHMEIQHYTW